MQDAPTLDGWPVVEIHYPKTVTLETMVVVYAAMGEYLGRKEPFAVVHHTTSNPDAKTRQYMADMRKQQARLSCEFLKGEALIAESTVIRGAATAVAWLFPHPHPFKAFRAAPEAISWAKTQLGIN
jgi:hypothetical protein